MPPAARQGDPTVHGGVITAGEASVLIGGMPAARISDMHACPMVTGTVPHVGGPISAGCASVLIGPMPAARIGDMLVCTGPPDTIAMGEMSVLIGDLAGGGGGGEAAAATAAGALSQAESLRDARRNGDPYCDIHPDVPLSHFSTETLTHDDRPPPGQEQRRRVIACDLNTLALTCGHGDRAYTLQAGKVDEKGQRLDTLEVVCGPEGDRLEVVTELQKPYCPRHVETPIIVSKGTVEGLTPGPTKASAKFKAEPALSLREQLTRDPFALLWPHSVETNVYNVLAPTCGLTRAAKVVVYPDLHWEIGLGIALGRDSKKRRWSTEGSAKIKVKYGAFSLDYSQKITQYVKTALSAAKTAAAIIDKTSHALDRWTGSKLEPQLPNLEISGEWGWREVAKSWRAGYELKVSAAFDPLIGLSFELDIIAAILAAVGSPLAAKLKKLSDDLVGEIGVYLMADGTIGGELSARRVLGQTKPVCTGKVEGKIEISLEGRIKAEKKWLFFSVSVDVRAGGRSGITAELRPVADRTGFGVAGSVKLDEGVLYFHGAASAGFELFNDESRKGSEEGGLRLGAEHDASHTLWEEICLAQGTAYFIKNGDANVPAD
jgi:uncharacterized Zn-binding protein involved in type VI secretion